MRLLFPCVALALSLTGCLSQIDRLEASESLFRRENALVKRDETFLARTGGACLGPCPVYEIYLFESGRVLFNGQEYTATRGVVESRIDPARYRELVAILKRHHAFSKRACTNGMTDHSRIWVISSGASGVRAGNLDYGCENHVKDAEEIQNAFVRISGSEALIGHVESNWPEANPHPK